MRPADRREPDRRIAGAGSQRRRCHVQRPLLRAVGGWRRVRHPSPVRGCSSEALTTRMRDGRGVQAAGRPAAAGRRARATASGGGASREAGQRRRPGRGGSLGRPVARRELGCRRRRGVRQRGGQRVDRSGSGGGGGANGSSGGGGGSSPFSAGGVDSAVDGFVGVVDHVARASSWTARGRRPATRRGPGCPARARRRRSARPWWRGAQRARTRRRRAPRPGAGRELQPALVAVAGVDRPVAAGLAAGDLVPFAIGGGARLPGEGEASATDDCAGEGDFRDVIADVVGLRCRPLMGALIPL